MSDDDPGLPIKFGPCSNGEFVPKRLSAVEREAIARARLACATNAKRLGIPRADFLRSVCGAATTLLTLQGVLAEASRRALGGFWEVPAEGALEPAAARSALAGEQFVFDVQGHHLEYQLMPKDRNKPFFGSVFLCVLREDDVHRRPAFSAVETKCRHLDGWFKPSWLSQTTLTGRGGK